MSKTYEATQKGRSALLATGWTYLDLENRKQTGDLEKKMLHFRNKTNSKVFNFVSSRRREGVSTVLANLVKYLETQQSQERIMVVDANFTAPSLHTIFNVPNEIGLTDALVEGKKLRDIAVPLGSTNISLVCSGKGHVKHSGRLEQERFLGLINEAKTDFDYILIDSAGVLTSSDTVSTAVASDVTFLIIESLKVQKEVALKTKFLLLDNECVIGGVVLNRIQQVIPDWMYKII